MTTSAHEPLLVGVNRPTSPARVRAREKDQQVLDLRLEGKSFREIARELDISAAGAQKCLGRVMAAKAAQLGESADALRALEHERLEKASAVYWPLVLEKDIQATKIWLKLRERNAKLLDLDLRQEAEVGGTVIQLIEARLPGERGGWKEPDVIDMPVADEPRRIAATSDSGLSDDDAERASG